MRAQAHLLRLLYSRISSSSSSSSHQFHHHRFIYPLLHFSSSSSLPVQNSHSAFIDYLINTFGFSKTQLDSVSKYIQSTVKEPKKPDSIINLLREFGFSEIQIRKAIVLSPSILFADAEKIIKPKLSLFQNDLGITGSNLGLFISKNPCILDASLERRLIPNISFLKKCIPGFVPLKCYRIFRIDPKVLVSNVSFLQSCGIVGSQLYTLLKQAPWMFSKKESAVKDLVLKAQEMGFSCDSRMLAHALHTLGCLSSKTLEAKFKLLRSFGFSQEECSAMFIRTPNLFCYSEKRLKLGIQFFDSVGLERAMLVHNPVCLMYSLERRVIPRFRVYQILKSKQQQLLNNKCPSFVTILKLNEKVFLEKFVFKLGDNAEELLAAYNNGNGLNSSTGRN